MVKGRSAKLPGGLCCVIRARNQPKNITKMPPPNAYSVARAKSAYHGCILEADRAFNAMSMSVFRELSSDVWTGRVKDWPKFIIIGMRIALAITAAGVKLSSRLRMSAPFEWTNRGNAPYRGPPANAQRGRAADELGQKRVWTQLGQKRVWT